MNTKSTPVSYEYKNILENNNKSPYELKKYYKLKVSELESLRYENNLIENQIKIREQRFEERENEYQSIIKKLKVNYENRENKVFDTKEKLKDLETVNSLIQNNMDNIKSRTYKVLAEQERDIIKFYNTKIKELHLEFEYENLKKSKKDAAFLKKENKLIKELEWVKDISKKIDDENHYWIKNYMELNNNYNNNLVEYDELLSHYIFLKKKNAILFSKYTDLRKIFEKVKEMETKEADKKLESSINNCDIKEKNLSDNVVSNYNKEINYLKKRINKLNQKISIISNSNKLKDIITAKIIHYINSKNDNMIKVTELFNSDIKKLSDSDRSKLIDIILTNIEVKNILNNKLEVEVSSILQLKSEFKYN